MQIHGWALDDSGIAWVDILVDGKVVGRAEYGRSRPGVTQSFPGYPDSEAPGFAYQLNTTHFTNGQHTVSARVRSNTGESLNLNSVSLEFLNLSHNLVPFGRIEFPNEDAQLFGTCDLSEPRRLSVVSGYALDTGVQAADSGVRYVELLIDGSSPILLGEQLHHSQVSCTFDAALGGYSNCYGLPREDVRQLYDLFADDDPPNVGFRFVLDVGLLINLGYSPGHHDISIRAGDRANQASIVDQFSVFFACDEFLGNQGSFGQIQRPRGGLIYQGTTEIVGWALDWEEVHDVTVYIDGVFAGSAEYGFARPGVTYLYPGYPDSLLPGWRFLLDTTQLSNNRHFINVYARDFLGQQTLIGERTFVVFNP